MACSNAQFIPKLALRRRLWREFFRRDHIEASAGTGHPSGYKGKICNHASRRRASYFLLVILSLCSSASASTRVLEIFSVNCSHYTHAVAKLMEYVRQLMALRHQLLKHIQCLLHAEIAVLLFVCSNSIKFFFVVRSYYRFKPLTLNLLTTTIVAPPSNASKWQMGFNSAFKGLM